MLATATVTGAAYSRHQIRKVLSRERGRRMRFVNPVTGFSGVSQTQTWDNKASPNGASTPPGSDRRSLSTNERG